MMKLCNQCQQSRSLDNFTFVRPALDRRNDVCSECIHSFWIDYQAEQDTERRAAGHRSRTKTEPAAEPIKTKHVNGRAYAVLSDEEIAELRVKLNITVEEKPQRAMRKDAGTKRGAATCTADEGCDRETKALDLCSMHWQRQRAA